MALFDTRPFADAEEVTRKLLRARLLPGVTVVSATGPNLAPPTVVARRIGGDCDGVTDFATMLVTTLCLTRPESNLLSAQIQSIVLSSVCVPILLDDGQTALVDNMVVMVADHPEMYDNPDVRQVSATYELRMRRPWPAA